MRIRPTIGSASFAVLGIAFAALLLKTGPALYGQIAGGASPYIVMDDGDAGYARGSFSLLGFAAAYRKDVGYAYNNSVAAITPSRYTFTNLTAGKYTVFATWPALSTAVNAAPYRVLEGTTVLGSYSVNQRQRPVGILHDGATWQILGEITLQGTSVVVEVTKQAGMQGTYIFSDGIMLQKVASVCGNGNVESDEQCDDGNQDAFDGCTKCVTDTCEDSDASDAFPGGVGNDAMAGTVRSNDENGETVESQDACADEGLQEFGCEGTILRSETISCEFGCNEGACLPPPYCGNAVVDEGEDCDDGNGKPGDGCSPVCSNEMCGDGVPNNDEECDRGDRNGSPIDAAHVPSAACNLSCKYEFCGDGAVQEYLGETCDDGNRLRGDGCSESCGNETTPTGSLFISQDSTPLRPRQLLGGALGEAILRLQMRAEVEDIDVTNLQFTSRGSEARSVDRLELFTLGSTSPFAVASIGGCGSDDIITEDDGVPVTTFCANMESEQLVVPEGQSLDVIVRPRLRSDQEGGMSNELIRLFVSGRPIADNTTGAGAVRARGRQSSNTLVANNGNDVADGEIFIGTDEPSANTDIVGRENRSVLAKIVSIANANPDPDGTNVPTGVSPIGQFKFATASNNNSANGLNKAVIDGLIFSVNAQNVQLHGDEFRFLNKADSSMTAPCTAVNVSGAALHGPITGTFLVQCQNLSAGSVDTQIGSGETNTFVLNGNILNPSISASQASSLTASLDHFTDSALERFSADVFFGNHIKWNDQDATGQTMYFWVEYPDTTVRSTRYGG